MTNEEKQLVKQAKAEYHREYRRRNREKIKASDEQYWLRKALEKQKQ